MELLREIRGVTGTTLIRLVPRNALYSGSRRTRLLKYSIIARAIESSTLGSRRALFTKSRRRPAAMMPFYCLAPPSLHIAE